MIATRTHRARTTQQLLDAAMQGEQFPCGSIADHYDRYGPRHQCPQCTERRERMTDAYAQGKQDAQERQGLYDRDTIAKERQNGIKAYEEATTEPAVSYLVGYVGASFIP